LSSNIFNTSPFLRTSRSFPQEAQSLSVEIDRSYLDIANAVNVRTIGIFTVNKPIVNGESWYISGGNQKKQALRQVYTFTSAGNIAHGINISAIFGFVKIYGTFTDGSVWYPLPYVDATAANNQVQVTVTSTNIVITAGGGTPPTVTFGTVVLEWVSFT
jgi:hypothetical protein